jgi:Uri superfamily endonuclease
MNGQALRSYRLLIEVRRAIRLRVGRLGVLRFPPGWYAYTGSARRNLEARIARHLSQAKRLHWHIDYLLARPAARVVGVQRSRRPECLLNRLHSGAIVAPGFGASDCQAGCGSHLKYLGPPGRVSVCPLPPPWKAPSERGNDG